MAHIKWEDLSVAQRRELAERLAEDTLPELNRQCREVVPSRTIYARFVKRWIDVVVAFLAVVITLPINLIIGIITFFDVGRPIFFTQQRLGRGEKLFTLVKFRNMRNTVNEKGDLLTAADRVTKFGKLVRKTSLDELLNFWSVLKGDMSLIGPRPLLPQYLPRFNARHRGRFCVRPGLECPPRELMDRGWNWQERLDNDVWYVEHLSFLVDCRMLVNVVRYALDPRMAKIRADAKMGTFMGYDRQGVAITQRELEEEYPEYLDAFAAPVGAGAEER